MFGENMDNAAICDADNRVLVDMDPARIGNELPPVTPANDLDDLIDRAGRTRALQGHLVESAGKFEFSDAARPPIRARPRSGSLSTHGCCGRNCSSI